MDGAADADEASREAAAAAAELGIDSYPSEQEAGDGRESAQHDAFGRVQATQVYVSILDEFGLSETNHIRLIQVSYDRFERMYNTTKDANWNFTDVSEGAREFLKTHPYAEHRREWLKQHPTIAKHPEMAREYLARENRRQELQDALRQDSRSRVALVPPTPSTLDVGGHGPKWIARETAAAQAVADEADEGHIDG